MTTYTTIARTVTAVRYIDADDLPAVRAALDDGLRDTRLEPQRAVMTGRGVSPGIRITIGTGSSLNARTGEWIVYHPQAGHAEILTDEVFRATYQETERDTAPPLPPRTTCGVPCPEHEHVCPRSRDHGGPCRPVVQKGSPGHRCDWMDGRVIR